jgi:hypothetical protein
MSLFKRRLHWIFIRAWPFWLLVLALALTLAFGTWNRPSKAQQFNKFFGAGMQALGAFLVLISIDGNLGLFRGLGVFAEVREYVSRYPRRQANVSLIAASCAQANASGSLASIRVQATDIDGRVATLERWCKELETRIAEERAEIIARVDKVQDTHREAMSKQDFRLDELAWKVEETAVGGTKLQALGVGLAVLGSVLSIYS